MNPELYISSRKLVVRIKESQQHILHDQKHPLFALTSVLLWKAQDVATFRFRLLKGDIHCATYVGIYIGQTASITLDSEFLGISMYLGMSAYIEMYVKLLVQISKLKAIIHSRKKAVEILLMRYNRVAELFSFAPANNLETQ